MSERPDSLPTPSDEALAHSRRLCDRIRAEIEAEGGWIPFRRYMEMVLYEPGLGYYRAGAAKFGPAGDFITAPEITPRFGHCVAQQCREVLEALEDGVILEFGAGTGALAASLLEALGERGPVPEYWILEPSAELQARQRERLEALPAALTERVRWLERLPETPFKGVVLANEVLDAMPVERFRWTGEALERLGVAVQADELVEAAQPADRAFVEGLRGHLDAAPETLPAGYISEWCPEHGPWVATVADRLDAGLMLLIDYGFPRHEFYHQDRAEGTLMCHYRHRAHGDPLRWPGLQDITAHVEFTSVAEAAHAAGFQVAGFTSQAQFLMNTGLLERLPDPEADTADRLKETNAINRLTSPAEMGELFKALALTRRMPPGLSGFARGDQRQRL